MNKSTDLRTGRSCVFILHVHLVFVTKYRRKVFSKQILTDLKAIFEDICNDFESQLVEFEGEGDHVHLLVNYPPKVAISKLVNSLKGVSSRLIRKKKICTYPGFTLGQSFMVSQLFCGSLWGSTLRDY
jgi:putative transposase